MSPDIMITEIKDEKDYEVALERVQQLMDAERDSPEGRELDSLATLVEKWEDEHIPAFSELRAKEYQKSMEKAILIAKFLAGRLDRAVTIIKPGLAEEIFACWQCGSTNLRISPKMKSAKCKKCGIQVWARLMQWAEGKTMTVHRDGTIEEP